MAQARKTRMTTGCIGRRKGTPGKPQGKPASPPTPAGQIERTPDPVSRIGRSPKKRGSKSGLGLFGLFVTLFELNERMPPKRRMTDEEIKRQVLADHPDMESKLGALGQSGKVSVAYYRSLFNRGRLSTEKPRVKSYRYNIDGLRINPHSRKVLEG